MKKLMLGAMLVATAVAARAEPIRTLLTKENQLPEKGQVEVGLLANTRQYEAKSDWVESPYVRYGLFGNLAGYVAVPVHQTRFKRNAGTNQNGLGDVAVGFDLVAYEDIFRFPYILPHVEVGFPTGDEDKGFGAGEVYFRGGITVGTKTWECVNWAVDVTGQHLNTKDLTLKSDTIVVSGSLVWDLDEQFSLIGEVSGSDQNYPDGHPVTYEAGMTYKPVENLMFGIYGGKTTHTSESWNGSFKAAYSF
jgi:hypothetical protein